MPIPSVPAEALLAALTRFDHELRDTPGSVDWEGNKADLYAITHAGQRYPDTGWQCGCLHLLKPEHDPFRICDVTEPRRIRT
jgi:hypothetical protein